MDAGQLKKLKRLLPRKSGATKGYRQILSEQCGCSERTVSSVLSGNRKDYYGIIEAAIILVEKIQAEQQALNKKIQEVA